MIDAAVGAAVDAAIVGWQGPVTFISLAGFVVLAILRGWLIPKSSHEREIQVLKEASDAVVKAKDTRITELIEEKNEWRGTAGAAEKVSAEVRRQNGELLEVARTTAYALDEMRRGLQPQKDVTPT